MPRYFEKISEAEFMEKLLAAAKKHTFANYGMDEESWNYHLSQPDDMLSLDFLNIPDLSARIQQDLSKIEFCAENCGTELNQCALWRTPDGLQFLGLHTTSEGLTYLGLMTGGDWESMLSFVLYWDGTQFRAYIPEDGNLFNSETKTAYGNDDESDARDQKRKKVKIVDEILVPDFARMLADVKNRIQPRP